MTLYSSSYYTQDKPVIADTPGFERKPLHISARNIRSYEENLVREVLDCLECVIIMMVVSRFIGGLLVK